MDLSSRTDDGLLICLKTRIATCISKLTYACSYTCDIDCTIGMFVENIYSIM